MNGLKILFNIEWSGFGNYFDLHMEPLRDEDVEGAIHEVAHGVHILGDEFFAKPFMGQDFSKMIWRSYPTKREAGLAEIEVSAMTSLALKLLDLHSDKEEERIRKSMLFNSEDSGLSMEESNKFYEMCLSSEKLLEMAQKILNWIQTENYIRANSNYSVVQSGKFWKTPAALRKSLKTTAAKNNAVWCNVAKSKKLARVTA